MVAVHLELKTEDYDDLRFFSQLQMYKMRP